MTQQDYVDPFRKIYNFVLSWRGSRKLVLVIVAIALLLDNMLLTSVGKGDFKLIFTHLGPFNNVCVKYSIFLVKKFLRNYSFPDPSVARWHFYAQIRNFIA